MTNTLLFTLFGGLEQLDKVRLNFSDGGVVLMNIAIAFVMFGVALNIKLEHFKDLAKSPKTIILGVISQYVMLPLVTFLLVLLINPTPAVAFGMILVAACPGGNISNMISMLAKANVALAVSLTAFTTAFALIMTPFNFSFWGGLYASQSPYLVELVIEPSQIFQTIGIILGIPVALGIFVGARFPKFREKIQKPVRWASFFVLIGFIVGALAANIDHFMRYIHLVFFIVLIHNGLAFAVGYWFPKIFKEKTINSRTISIETGIQNSGLGLALIFNPKIFPPELELGGMAFIAAWWGVWHIVAGSGLAWWWSKRPVKSA
ncbi:MAG TPA: bile acid:sodium symporter family protein [Bacteroidales bacterium]|nr:bile acid:sodium symporter family protein [Bacteroidales bacterium]